MGLDIVTCKVEGDMMCFEFAFSRKGYKINGTSIGLFAKFYHCDWDNAIYVYNKDGKDSFHLALDKTK